LPGLLALIALACIGRLVLLGSIIRKNIAAPPVTLTVTTAVDVDPSLTVTAGTSEPAADLSEKIVYTCQINRANNSDQICLIYVDRTGQRQLTESNDNQDASLSPDGQSVIFVSNQSGRYEIFETDLSGKSTRLTDMKSMLGVPEISPDNNWIVYTNRVDNFDQIWVMDRDVDNAQVIFRSEGNAAVAPTWSPDGKQILFAVGKDLDRQLYIMGFDGRDPHLLSDQILTPGRTDWSPQNMIAYFIGDAWHREVWTMFSDGTGLVQVTDGDNAQSSSFSSGGRYIAFTGYTDVDGRDELSCEIFIMDLFSKEKLQLTKNDYCDYQPRWGN
jgi:TolB protein